LGIDPLRQLLAENIDFGAVRRAPIDLMIVATDIATGRPRFFRREEITINAVLASACLPTLHHAVEIDGRAYWDGGFSANPDIVEIALENPCRDTLIVLLNPSIRTALPVSAQEIAAHQNMLTFNAPLLRDVAVVEAVRESEGGWLARAVTAGLGRRRSGGASRLSALARHRYHMIEAGRHTRSLPAESKLKPDWGLFQNLRSAGRQETHLWLDTQLPSVGRRATVDLNARFLAEPTQAMRTVREPSASEQPSATSAEKNPSSEVPNTERASTKAG
ncbi:MAG: hypothetical protein K2Y05_06285, partial [Hyphomicrobiaceae bacterium]|nr:hypothetical protein [Hyphomicrobiaceae bacterium]